ncbi:glycosyltransferase [Pedobacter agri]|uniref:glycosyltransferase n=1 Tax=Pedobacter agri TaxID=454586 RepID=UPI002930F72C|nr:glycosyltransferase [Pedobacter agri]
MAAEEKYLLSYVISTYNRLPFLKRTLERLLKNLGVDEEIVIVDGDSCDGTKEYLQQLFSDGKIHQFISEPDRNQAHGWNKAMLISKGRIIKKIIDDDVFCYKSIRDCKEYMLNNPEVDVIISNDLHSSISQPAEIMTASRLVQYLKWKNKVIPSFTFSDVHQLIRKDALSLIGLYNTSYVMIDWEYSLRISYLKAKIVYFTGFNALSVAHSNTVSYNKNLNLIKEQGKRGAVFYEYAGDQSEINNWSKIKIAIGKRIFKNKVSTEILKAGMPDYDNIYESFYSYIDNLNGNNSFIFIHPDFD